MSEKTFKILFWVLVAICILLMIIYLLASYQIASIMKNKKEDIQHWSWSTYESVTNIINQADSNNTLITK